MDEIYKILYFNNSDPETYSIMFWADYFQLSPAVVRNVVNYIAYPVVDLNTKKVKDVLYFVDTELQKRRKELADLDREAYLRFLEVDYSKRMLEAHQDEKGFFGIGGDELREQLAKI